MTVWYVQMFSHGHGQRCKGRLIQKNQKKKQNPQNKLHVYADPNSFPDEKYSQEAPNAGYRIVMSLERSKNADALRKSPGNDAVQR